MSKSLIKLLDYSLLPAALFVVGKFIGLIFSINLFGLEWGIESLPNSLFSARPILFSEDVIIASTYSDIIMFVIMASGFSFVLIQALVFHDSHIKPSLITKLATNNLMGLIKSTFEIYHLAAIWGLYLWLSVASIFYNFLLGKTESWVPFLAVFVTIILSVLVLRDVYDEVDISKTEKLGM